MYKNEKIIVGISKVMYNGKWYVVLYKTKVQDYVVIYYKGEYIKVSQYDVEDCIYNNTVFDSSCGYMRLFNKEEMAEVIAEGKRYVAMAHNTYKIYALVNNMEIYVTNSLALFFDIFSKELKMCIPVNNDEYNKKCSDWFKAFINDILKLESSEKRKGMNKLMINTFPSEMYSKFNHILRTNDIKSDADAKKCILYNFVTETADLIDNLEIIF